MIKIDKYVMPDIAPVLTQEQQKYFFKVGDEVIIRPDFELYTCSDYIEVADYSKKIGIIQEIGELENDYYFDTTIEPLM